MRTAIQETTPQISLRDCSIEAVGEGQNMILMKGEFNATNCLLYIRFSTSQEELMLPQRDSVLF